VLRVFHLGRGTVARELTSVFFRQFTPGNTVIAIWRCLRGGGEAPKSVKPENPWSGFSKKRSRLKNKNQIMIDPDQVLIAIVIPMKNVQSGSAENFSIKVRLKISNQGLIDPDQVFNHGHDRDEKFSSKIRSKRDPANSRRSILSPRSCATSPPRGTGHNYDVSWK